MDADDFKQIRETINRALAELAANGVEVVSPVEIPRDCGMTDLCIDRYLWALYERTPKEDTNKVQEQRKVTVKRKGKLVTVTWEGVTAPAMAAQYTEDGGHLNALGRARAAREFIAVLARASQKIEELAAATR